MIQSLIFCQMYYSFTTTYLQFIHLKPYLRVFTPRKGMFKYFVKTNKQKVYLNVALKK